jgi:hypothetical protein
MRNVRKMLNLSVSIELEAENEKIYEVIRNQTRNYYL